MSTMQEEYGVLAAQKFKTNCSEILSCLKDPSALDEAFGAFTSLHPPSEEIRTLPEMVAYIEFVFVTLYQRGRIQLCEPPIPELAQEELGELIARVESRQQTAAPAKPTPERKPRVVVVDPVDEAVAYWNAHPSVVVRTRMEREPSFRAAVEAAIEQKRI